MIYHCIQGQPNKEYQDFAMNKVPARLVVGSGPNLKEGKSNSGEE